MSAGGARGSWWRCGTVWLVSTAVAGGLVRWLLPELTAVPELLTGGRPAVFETMLVSLAAVAAAGCIVWLWLVTTLTAAAAAAGRARSRLHGCPEAWRRLVLTACGVALSAGLLVPAAHATDDLPVPIAAGQGDPDRGAALVRGLPLPDRPTTGPVSPVPPVGPVGPAPPRGHLVVVQPGDSLWAIAADHWSGWGWRRLYAANRAVIGDDPDLIHPGQRLRVPPAWADR